MKVAIFAIGLALTISASARAERIENLPCVQLRTLQKEIKVAHNLLYCEGRKSGDAGELNELANKMIFQMNRFTKVIETMRAKNCSMVTLPEIECPGEASRKQICENALNENDYDTYRKYCQ